MRPLLFLLVFALAGALPARGEELFSDAFDREKPGPAWKTHENAFSIRDGYLVVQQQPGTDHGAVGETLVDFKDAVIEFKFRFAGSPTFNLVIDDKNYEDSHAGHICRLRINPRQIVIGDDKIGVMENKIFAMRRGTPEEKAKANELIEGTLATLPADLNPETWYHLSTTLSGPTMTVVLDGETLGSLTSEGIDHPTKTDFGFTVTGGEMHFDDIRVTAPAERPNDEEQAGVWPVERLQAETPEFRVDDDSTPIHSLIYEGEEIGGEPTEVFAFYASPRTLDTAEEGETFPGIVLIHGGGGTAFSDWVWMWAQRGYAAIAMDLSGRRPPAPRFREDGGKIEDHNHPREERVRLEKGGLDHTHEEKFESIGGTVEDDWPYHAVANAMRAHTLIRSLPGVDPERTAVTGISWGGYTTCLVASLDDRFKAAVPVYGCGFLHEGESVQKPSIDALGERRDAWVAAYDPSSHLGKSEVPMLWVNGTHDKHYPLDSYAKSYALVKGPRTLRIQPRMSHGHGPGWAPKEIGLFVDSILKEGALLAEVGEMTVHAQTVTVPFESPTEIVKAELHFTSETGPRAERDWRSLPADIGNGEAVARGLPAEANTWLMTLTDDRGAMVSSEVRFRK
ncbi:MAG: PhoPQ-activated protein PqaA family protein [Verrucomicrobiales bacterium]